MRIYKKNIKINKESTLDFFKKRAERYSSEKEYSSILYQDNNPKLAIDRDLHEKSTILPRLLVDKESRVLDVGCGIGRWGDSLCEIVGTYLGVDFSEELINIAKDRLKKHKNMSFLTLDAKDISTSSLNLEEKFTHIIISGLLLYMNDDECEMFFSNLTLLISNNCRIYIREPLSEVDRLSLDSFHSKELDAEYSAIYGTLSEIEVIVSNFVLKNDFKIEIPLEPLYRSDELLNRKETQQYFTILQRG